MFVVLMILTVLLVLLLVIVLVVYLIRIQTALISIGGDGKSYLSKLRLGLRAIERETGHLPKEVSRLNETLSATSDGLKVVDDNMAGAIDAISKQKNA